jgi:hypothetical protein
MPLSSVALDLLARLGGALIDRLVGGRERGRKVTAERPDWAAGADGIQLAQLTPPPSSLPGGPVEGVRGREEVTRRLRRAVRHPPARPIVLAGQGGAGKSTLALFAAEIGRQEHRPTWWVSASDEQSLVDGIAAVVREAGGSEADIAAIRSSSPDAPDRLRRRLDRHPPGWVLVVDNLDDLGLIERRLAWLPVTDRGLVLVTTRVMSSRPWDSIADRILVGMLSPEAAADVLLDLAPGGGDRSSAVALAERVGFLPLGLRLAGGLVSAEASAYESFDSVRVDLQACPAVDVLLPAGSDRDDARLSLSSTFALSLDGLDRHGLPECRPLIRLLACFAAAVPIPMSILHSASVTALISGDASGGTQHRGVNGLVRAGLADCSIGAGDRTVILHPLVAAANRPRPDDHDRSILGVAVEALGDIIGVYGEIRRLTAAGRAGIRSLTIHLRELLRTEPARVDRTRRADLVATAAYAAEVLVEDRDDQAGLHLVEAAARWASELDSQSPAMLALRHVRARILLELGEPVAAQVDLQRVHADRVRMLGAEHSATLESLRQYGWTFARQHRYAEARDILLRILATEAAEDVANEILMLHVRCMANWVTSCLGDTRDAERGYREVIAGRTRALGPEHLDTLDARHSLGKVLIKSGDLRAARIEFRNLRADQVAALGADHPDTLETRKYAALTSATPQWRIRRELRQVLAAETEQLGADHPKTLHTAAQIARPDPHRQ